MINIVVVLVLSIVIIFSVITWNNVYMAKKCRKKIECRRIAQKILGKNLVNLKKCSNSDVNCNKKLWNIATENYFNCMRGDGVMVLEKF
jgi:hypothetical protein